MQGATQAGRLAVFALSVLVAFVACFGDDKDATKGKAAKDARPQEPVDVRRAAAAAVVQTALRVPRGEAANWLSPCRPPDEQRFSALPNANARQVQA